MKWNIDGFKIHTSDLSNFELLRLVGKSRKPVLLSTAGSTLNEIEIAFKILSEGTKEITLMHGFQGYPTKISEMHLKRIITLKERFGFPVGIMDHSSGSSTMSLIVPLLAVSLGASIVEKHITYDRSQKGIDYFSALNPDKFKTMVSLLGQTILALGSTSIKLNKNEIDYRLSHKKSLLAKKTIKKGTKFNEKLFSLKRTARKTELITFNDVLGKKAVKNIPKGKFLEPSMIERKSHIVAILACRVSSERLFAKPLQLIDGKPILLKIIDQIKKSKLISDIVLAISENEGNEIFVKLAKKQGLKYIIGDEFDVLKRLIDGAEYLKADIVFRCTSENPFLYWEKIDELIGNHVRGRYDYTYIENLPMGCLMELVNTVALKKSHKFGSKRHRSELCTLYINENRKKFKICAYLPPKKLQRPDFRLTVDTPEDLIVARLIHKALGKKSRIIPMGEIIEFLENNPQIRKINSDVPIEFTRYDKNQINFS